MITLKGGQTTQDVRLDRVVQFDERSRAYPIRSLVATKTPRNRVWTCPVTLDQGQNGYCVGFSWNHELAATPKAVPNITNQTALVTYHRAQELDEWAGENYEGTSVLAGAKALTEQGYYGEYRWAFGLSDLVLALGYNGPAVLGIPWYESMFDIVDGFVKIAGGVAGGHAILALGVNVTSQYVILHNSWGPDWGLHGNAKISFADLERLLHEDGEACVPLKRKTGPS